jgi:hypothetical protein
MDGIEEKSFFLPSEFQNRFLGTLFIPVVAFGAKMTVETRGTLRNFRDCITELVEEVRTSVPRINVWLDFL